MFTNERHTTEGVEMTVSLNIQLILWNMIDDLQEVIKLDYLQIFNLTDNIITHSQEQPEYKNIIKNPFTVLEPLKIYVIDNGSYSTMLLAKEY